MNDRSRGRARCLGTVFVVAMSLGSIGCVVVGEDYTRPEIELSEAFAGRESEEAPQLDLGRWWEALNDSMLSGLVERALVGSIDIRAALASVRRAAALRGEAVGNRFPDLDGDGSYSRTRTGSNGVVALPDAVTTDLWTVGLSATWELDVWGRVTRLIEAADADLDVTVEDLRDLRALVVADVVAAYVDLRSGQARLDVAQKNIATQQQSYTLTVTRFEAGAAPRLDVSQARTNLANSRASLPQLRDSVRSAELRLGVLVGEDPSGWAAALEDRFDIPAPPDHVDTGVPAELLRQRPDVRSAERALAAEVARIGVEEGDLYPRFALVGSLGTESVSSGSLLDGDSGFFGIGPSFDWNLFDGGRVRGRIRAQRAAADAALHSYHLSVLVAVEEVERAIYGLSQDRERAMRLDEAADAAQESAELARELYLQGQTNFQNVLDAERSLFSAQDEQIEARANVTQRYVVLLRALGGGWQTTEPEAAK